MTEPTHVTVDADLLDEPRLVVEPGAFRTALFGGAFRTMPATEPYAATVGPIRAFAAASDGKQPGDPRKAARAIVDAVERAWAKKPDGEVWKGCTEPDAAEVSMRGIGG